jgi:DNA replication protein DnaC
MGEIQTFYSCDKCAEEYEKKEQLKRQKEEKPIDKFEHIPKIYKNAKIEDFKLPENVLEWIKQPDGFLFIYGQCGTGKTHLSCAVNMNFINKFMASKIVFSNDLFIDLRACFSKKEDSDIDIIKSMTFQQITIFDDIGVQKISEYVIESWYNIIDKRYREGYPTMFTSNLSIKELSSYMSERIASRISSGITCELNGKDRRQC